MLDEDITHEQGPEAVHAERARGAERAALDRDAQIREVVSAAVRRNGGQVARAGKRDGGGFRTISNVPLRRAEGLEEVEEMIEGHGASASTDGVNGV